MSEPLTVEKVKEIQEFFERLRRGATAPRCPEHCGDCRLTKDAPALATGWLEKDAKNKRLRGDYRESQAELRDARKARDDARAEVKRLREMKQGR